MQICDRFYFGTPRPNAYRHPLTCGELFVVDLALLSTKQAWMRTLRSGFDALRA